MTVFVELLTGINDAARIDLASFRSTYSGWQHLSTAVVVLGLLLEIPDGILELGESLHGTRWAPRGFREAPHQTLPKPRLERPFKIAAFIGMLLIAIGVTGELGFDSVVSRIDGQIEYFDSLLVSSSFADSIKATSAAAAASERTAQLENESARLRKLAEDAALARVALEEKVAWRSLSDDDKKRLAKMLPPFDGIVSCLFLSGDTEAFSFSSEIASALRLAKWSVVPPNPNVQVFRETTLPTTGSPIEGLDFGVELVSTSDALAVAAAGAVVASLEALGFDAHFQPSAQQSQRSAVWVTVDHRPLGPQGSANVKTPKKIGRPVTR